MIGFYLSGCNTNCAAPRLAVPALWLARARNRTSRRCAGCCPVVSCLLSFAYVLIFRSGLLVLGLYYIYNVYKKTIHPFQ